MFVLIFDLFLSVYLYIFFCESYSVSARINLDLIVNSFYYLFVSDIQIAT